MPTATKAARNGAAAPAAAIAPVTRSVAAVTSMLRSAAGKAHERSDAVTTELKIAAMTVDYPQAGHHLGDPTAWV